MEAITKPISVLIADDHPTLRAGVRAALDATDDIVVVGEVEDGDHVVARCQETRPDVLLLDLQMPGPGPFAIVADLRAQLPALKIVVLTAHDDDIYVRSMLAAGVAGYVRKDEPAEAIVAAVRAAAQGGTWLSRPIAEKLAQRAVTPPAVDLAERERAVLRLLVEGRSNREIGRALGVSEKAIERRVSEICAKLGVSTRVAAAVRAVREGLV